MIITEKTLKIEDSDVLTAHHKYRSANLRRWQYAYADPYKDENTNLDEALQRRGIWLDNHEVFVFSDVAIRYTDGHIAVGKVEDVYKGGWGFDTPYMG